MDPRSSELGGLAPDAIRWEDSGTMDRNEGPSFIAMIALVAVVVATVILVFFGIGYAIGRMFL